MNQQTVQALLPKFYLSITAGLHLKKLGNRNLTVTENLNFEIFIKIDIAIFVLIIMHPVNKNPVLYE